MKTVGQQLEEARLAREWTPELASRETKIKVERLLDLESDNFSNFSSPAYARGFVRTYARALQLDEYKLLRQLDHKLPDDSGPLAIDTGVTYIPEHSEITPAVKAKRPGGGLLNVLGIVILLIMAWVAFEFYRATFLTESKSPETTESTSSTKTNTLTSVPAPVPTNTVDAPPVAVPVALPPVAVPAQPVQATPAANTQQIARALPIDSNTSVNPTPAVAVPVDPNSIPTAPAALPVTSPTTNSTAPESPVQGTPPKALPVTLDAPSVAPAPDTSRPPLTLPALPVTTTEASTPLPPASTAPVSAQNTAVLAALPVQPDTVPSSPPPSTSGNPIHLKLVAQSDSFVNVTQMDDADGSPKLLYAGMLKAGDPAITFSARRLRVNIGIPNAVTVTVNGVNFPHNAGDTPETFMLESKKP